MSSNDFDISNIANLARLNISDSERQKLQSDMNRIVDYIGQLSELDISGTEPTFHVASLKNIWRQDVSEKVFLKDKFLGNAPDTIDNELIKVPKVLPGEEEL